MKYSPENSFMLTELPNELLLEIGTHLAVKDRSQARLAMTCRHFYFLFMPTVLEDHTKHVEKLAKDGRLILRESPDRKSWPKPQKDIGQVIHPFKKSYLTVHVYLREEDSFKDIRCIRGLINRSHSIHEVGLFFMRSGSLRDAAAVVNTCARRDDMRLTVSGRISYDNDEQGPFSFDFQTINTHSSEKETLPTSRVRWFLQMIRSLFSGPRGKTLPPEDKAPLTTSYVATPRVPPVEFPLPSMALLQSFTINGETLFQPSLYPTVLNIFRSTSLQRLCLLNIRLSLFNWTEILPLISLPALKCLAIGHVSIPVPDLLPFLQRHHTIQELDLTENVVIGVAELPITPILPKLKSMAANSEYIIPFLKHKELKHFSELQNIYVKPLYEHRPLIYPVFDVISEGHHSGMILTLDNLASSGLVEWFLGRYRNDPKLSGLNRRICGIQNLVITDPNITLPSTLVDDLEDWILRHRSLTSPSTNDNLSQFDWAPFTEYRQTLETLIWLAFPDLETLKIGEAFRAPPA